MGMTTIGAAESSCHSLARFGRMKNKSWSVFGAVDPSGAWRSQHGCGEMLWRLLSPTGGIEQNTSNFSCTH